MPKERVRCASSTRSCHYKKRRTSCFHLGQPSSAFWRRPSRGSHAMGGHAQKRRVLRSAWEGGSRGEQTGPPGSFGTHGLYVDADSDQDHRYRSNPAQSPRFSVRRTVTRKKRGLVHGWLLTVRKTNS